MHAQSKYQRVREFLLLDFATWIYSSTWKRPTSMILFRRDSCRSLLLLELLVSLLFFRLNALELAQFMLRVRLAHVVGGALAPFTNPFLLGLVPLDVMLAHAFFRVLALPETSSASLSQC